MSRVAALVGVDALTGYTARQVLGRRAATGMPRGLARHAESPRPPPSTVPDP